MKRLLTVILFLPVFLNAAIGITAHIGVASTSNVASYAGTNFIPANNTLLVAFVYATGTVITTSTMTGGSLTWTREATSVIGANMMVIFWARVGTGASTTPTFDCTGDNATGAIVTVIEFTGYDATTATPIRQVKLNTATTTSTNANLTFTNTLQTLNGYAIGWYGGLAAASSTAPTSWTENDDIAYATPSANGSVAYRAGGETTAGAFTFTNASTTWQAMGVEVWVSGAAPSRSNHFF